MIKYIRLINSDKLLDGIINITVEKEDEIKN